MSPRAPADRPAEGETIQEHELDQRREGLPDDQDQPVRTSSDDAIALVERIKSELAEAIAGSIVPLLKRIDELERRAEALERRIVDLERGTST